MFFLFDNIKSIPFRGIQNIFREFALTAVCSVVLFYSAGTVAWPNAWIYIILVVGIQIVQTLVIIIHNPGLMNERGTVIRSDTRMYELIFVTVYIVFVVSVSIVAGFDAVRYKWTSMSFSFMIPGTILLISSSSIGIWAMASNPFFAVTQRIQTEKKHSVISTGPYRYVRHPGYLSWIFSALSYPLLLGSAVSFIPVSLMILLFLIRTYLEDVSLQDELPGYKDYTKKIQYRLLPYIW